MSENLDRICDAAADRGEEIQRKILDHLGHTFGQKSLPDFTIQKAAELLGISISQIRALESAGRFPKPRTRQSGAIRQRVYNYNEVNELRKIYGDNTSHRSVNLPVKVTFSNLKGGVAKTTHAIHCAQYLAVKGYKVLLVDADPQATTTGAFGILPDIDLGESENLSAVILEAPDQAKKVVRKTYWHNLDLIPASLSLQRVDLLIARESEARSRKLGPPLLRLNNGLERLPENYDVIVTDTPPALGMLSLNAIAAANLLVIPVEPHMYSLGSSVQYFRILRDVIRRHRHELNLERINMLLTRVDEQSPETQGVIKLLMNAYGGMCLTNHMPLSRELQRVATDHQGLYEIEQPRGSRDTFSRAVHMMDRVNAEILTQIRSLWDVFESNKLTDPSDKPSLLGDMV
ncbi:MAG: AAA family ATPase [Candidatus Competibacteraceae bacterium]|jgi:chromosome partitioning protein|nr:AAA family ATPase [Candidatus Competibacteraceae bacterium]